MGWLPSQPSAARRRWRRVRSAELGPVGTEDNPTEWEDDRIMQRFRIFISAVLVHVLSCSGCLATDDEKQSL